MLINWKFNTPILACAVLLSSCSLNGNLVLHNSLSQEIVLSVTYETSGIKNHVIQSGDNGVLRINFNIDNEVSAAVGDEHWCYKIKAFPSAWVKPGVSGPKVFANLTSNRRIYIYPKESKEDSFYTKSPPVQPDGYPLVPSTCVN